VESFDPDEDTVYVEPDEDSGVQLDHDLVAIDVDRALDLHEEIAMVRSVAEGLSRREHRIIEAGTGVGKSLAYLVPAAMSRQRVVIATATKNLQDQLATKDAPTVSTHTKSKVAVLKGRNNYLCRNRAHALRGGQMSFDDGSEVPRGVADQMRRILAWSNETASGDRDELPFEVDARAWRGLSVTPQECLGRSQCPQGQACFAELAKDRAAESQLLIVNTHLYAAHLASGSMLLPAHEFVVFDEAHEILNIFATLLGTSLNASRLRALANVARSTLGTEFADSALELLNCADRLATTLQDQYDAEQFTGFGEDVLGEFTQATGLVTRIVEALRAVETNGSDAEARKIRALGPAIHLANDMDRVSRVRDGELLFLAKRDREVDIEVSLVDVAPRLAEDLWGNVTAVLTSATIPDTLAKDLGLEGVAIEHVDSPFDYQANSLLYVPQDFPSRNDNGAEEAIIEELIELIGAAGGRTLALFTNRAVMNRVAEVVETRVDTPILVQGTLSRQRIIEQFRDSAEASLFAVTSFWQGIDVPGHSLSLVTIDRLPFAVPNDPLAEARRSRSERPFYEVDLPRASMLLAQGVGRLIRTKTDRGVVAVLDTRLAESNYRSSLFRKLPPMKRTRDKSLVHAFLRELREDQ
jgi:ATP-dependent DNA helicase DinG